MKKFITIILIIGMVLSLNLNLFLVKPKSAKALDGGGSWAGTVKEIVLDAIGWIVSDMVIKPLEQKIMAWGTGKQTDTNQPFAVTDWLQYFKDAVTLGAARFIAEEFENTFNELDEFERDIKNTLDSLGISTYTQDLPTYSQYARPTLKNDLGASKYQKFVASGYSLITGGNEAWFSLLKPQNNVLGQILMAQNAREDAEEKQKEAAGPVDKGGYKDETTTTKTDVEACKEKCNNMAPGDLDKAGEDVQLNKCLKKCEAKAGIALNTKIKNLGSDIKTQLDNAMSADMQRVISADEISELIGILFSSILTKATTGLGTYFQTKNTTQKQVQRSKLKDKYSYLKATQQAITPEDLKNFDGSILTGILKSIQQISKSIVECNDKDAEMKFDDFAKNVSDILSTNVEAYYAGSTGLNMKPDFEILDSILAPYTVYGYSYGEVPASKIPSSCRNIIQQANLGSTATCKDIKSGLEPNYNSKCTDCLYDHDALTCPPDPKPPFVEPFKIVEIPATIGIGALFSYVFLVLGNLPAAVITALTSGVKPGETLYISQKLPSLTEEQIHAKQDFYNNCMNWYGVVQNRCVDCVKKVDEQCDKDDLAEKNQCILDKCNNYDDIAPHVVSKINSGLDFYNKCLIEEKKDACFTCLKEYFVPDYYCGVITDYVRRAITKYPAITYYERGGTDWNSYWVGPIDKILADARGGFCPENDGKESLPVDIICRIMPDYVFNGARLCDSCYQSSPPMTKAELDDITDSRPSAADCGNQRINVGGRDPLAAIEVGVFNTSAKCCPSIWAGHVDAKYFVSCIGSGPTIAVTPPPPNFCICGWDHPECCCAENWRPVALGRDGWVRPDTAPYGGDCFNAGFSSDGAHKFFMHMNNGSTTSDVPFIAAGGCSETDEGLNNTDQLPTLEENLAHGDDFIGDDLPDNPPNDTDATPPSGVVWSYEAEAGLATQFCIPNFSAGNYTVGVYHNDNQDIVSGIQLCQKCDPSDNGYPYYGTSLNQCAGKEDPLEVPTGCE